MAEGHTFPGLERHYFLGNLLKITGISLVVAVETVFYWLHCRTRSSVAFFLDAEYMAKQVAVICV